MTAICPGATDPGFFDVAGENAQVGARMSPERVVRAALRAVDRRASTPIPGRANRLLANAPRLAPRELVARAALRTMSPL